MAGEDARHETIAVYTALIRHELGLPPLSDALEELERRLPVRRTAAGVPLKAPAVVRMKEVLKQLRAGVAPSADMETFTEDLRFLRLFDDDAPALDDAALSRLLSDVVGPSAGRKRGPSRRGSPAEGSPTKRRARPASVTPIRRR